MMKVRLMDTNEIVEVTPNVGYGLVDSGKATRDLNVLSDKEPKKVVVKPRRARRVYKNRQMSTGRYKIK